MDSLYIIHALYSDKVIDIHNKTAQLTGQEVIILYELNFLSKSMLVAYFLSLIKIINEI